MDLDETLPVNVLEYFAEDSLIRITPQFRQDAVFLIAGKFGPFIPGRPCTVPLWLAITLKKRKLCRIHQPKYLSVEELEKYLKIERDPNFFAQLPQHYMEVAVLLLESASDDLVNPDQIRSMVNDLDTLRRSKVQRGLEALRTKSEYIKVDIPPPPDGGYNRGVPWDRGNTPFPALMFISPPAPCPPLLQLPSLTHLEINTMRPFFCRAFERFATLAQAAPDEGEGAGDTQPSAASATPRPSPTPAARPTPLRRFGTRPPPSPSPPPGPTPSPPPNPLPAGAASPLGPLARRSPLIPPAKRRQPDGAIATPTPTSAPAAPIGPLHPKATIPPSPLTASTQSPGSFTQQFPKLARARTEPELPGGEPTGGDDGPAMVLEEGRGGEPPPPGGEDPQPPAAPPPAVRQLRRFQR
ncbi:putative DNA replication complex GINS protein PSF2 [Paratrimastix pyriformis]|uniref:DNA replication complex GINS protein PSF2 n=1 Tax=Paratrimastix pyriformis TaxID=342808 RepID=A0ABQ8UEJ6_9EUKA|nr:putative DNA replication complex GINS protein PSF2 [Paratrimastix pyriformis]